MVPLAIPPAAEGPAIDPFCVQPAGHVVPPPLHDARVTLYSCTVQPAGACAESVTVVRASPAFAAVLIIVTFVPTVHVEPLFTEPPAFVHGTTIAVKSRIVSAGAAPLLGKAG